MSKLSFRARALDASKPMPTYMADEVPDLPDFSAINRAVPQMPTGMEKEEESEHHLQRAISAQQVYGSANHLVIPTPEFESCGSEYEKLYDNSCRQTKQYIHMQPLSMEQDIPDYNMDAEDEVWVKKQAKTFEITSIKFEVMMDRLEKGSGQQVVSLKEAKLLLKEDDDLIIAVYDYWLNKRLRIMQLGDSIPGTAALLQGCGLIPQVKQEKRDGSTSNNPYVAFRRRTEKMQTRKNRKNDEVSYEKMLKLKRDLTRAVTLLEMVKRREKSKREALHLTIEIVEKRYQMNDLSGEVLAECEELSKRQPSFTIPAIPNRTPYGTWGGKEEGIRKKREYKKRKHKPTEQTARQKAVSVSSYTDVQPPQFPEIRSSDEDLSPVQSPAVEEEQDPDGIFAFRRTKGCQYQAPHPELVSNWPWSGSYMKGVSDKKYRYSCTSLRTPKKCVGLARRRIGRGGRVLLDRAWTPHDEHFKDLEETEPSFTPTSPSSSPPPPSSWLSSVRRQSSSLPLNHILEEIKANRMLHFRPKTPPPQQQQQELEPMLADQASQLSVAYPAFALQQTASIPPSLSTQQQLLTELTVDHTNGPTMSTTTTTSLLESQITPAAASTVALQQNNIILQQQLQDTQDSQMVEVDVVGADGGTTELSTSFGSLPTSKFTLGTSVTTPTSKLLSGGGGVSVLTDEPPSLVQPAVAGVNHHHTGTKNLISNHIDVTKAPSGHSTAPAATVLQLNYPIPKPKPATNVSLLSSSLSSSSSSSSQSKVATLSSKTDSTTTTMAAATTKKSSMLITNVNSIETKSALTSNDVLSSVTTTLKVPALSSGEVRRNNLVASGGNQSGNNSVSSSTSSVVTAQQSSQSAVVKRIAQANNIAVLAGDRHEDGAPHINNQSVAMEVT